MLAEILDHAVPGVAIDKAFVFESGNMSEN